MSRVAELESVSDREWRPAPERAVAHAQAVPRVMSKAGRWLALDLFRFCAVVLMVQGHVFSTMLSDAVKQQGWYPHHSFVHGYTAPMFLFGAGLAFGYTTFRKWEQHTSGGAAARKRFKRYGWLLVIGYGLHMPTLAISRLFAIDDPARLARMFQVDVLQHIGVSLAICQLLVLFVKNQRVFVAIVGALAAFSVCAAPWVWNVDLSDSDLPVWLAGYVNSSTGSIFPLVPWSGFTYTGIVLAYVVGVGGSARSISDRLSWPFAALAVAFLLVPVVVDRFGPFPWPPHNFWKTNPLFFFWRLGNVIAVLAVLCFGEQLLSRLGWLDDAPSSSAGRAAKRIIPWVKLVGAESLIIYVAHLIVLHGSLIAPGIKHSGVVEEGSEGLASATAVALLLFLAMVLLAKLWNELKKNERGFAAIQIALVTIVAYLALAG